MPLSNKLADSDVLNNSESNIRIITADEFLLKSDLLADSKYKWLAPLIKPLLEGTQSDLSTSSYLESVFLLKAPVTEITTNSGSIEPEALKADLPVIKKISRINSVNNIGLLDLESPLSFHPGLNVIYGRNGAGKSSLYTALCKVFGCNKKALSNIEESISTKQSASLKILYNTGIEDDLNWSSDKSNLHLKTSVRIYDSEIHNYIIEEDQINKFEIAHLRSECFPLLTDLYSEVDKWIRRASKTIEDRINELEILLKAQVSDFESTKSFLLKKNIPSYRLNPEETKQLKTLEEKLALLNKEDPLIRKKSIENSVESLRKLLLCLGSSIKKTITNETEEQVKVTEWKLNIDSASFSDTNLLFQKLQTLNKQTKERLGILQQGQISDQWIKSKEWLSFVSASVGFVETLIDEEQRKLKEETCAYCLQPLTSESARNLIKAYFGLDSGNKDFRDAAKVKILAHHNLIKDAIAAVSGIKGIESALESDFSLLDQPYIKDTYSDQVLLILNNIAKTIEAKNPVNLNENEQQSINYFFNHYAEVFRRLEIAIDTLFKACTGRADDIKKTENAKKPLLLRKQLDLSKDYLTEYLDLSDALSKLDRAYQSLRQIKQRTGALQTQFAKEAPLKLFREKLDLEYKRFTFTPPQTFTLKARSDEQNNKRVYRLGGYKLAAVLSEGERRIHSLADFFAEAQLSQFQGVYIFDDPVNSLDEDNIENLAERLFDLVNAGHQVIVFTHNIFFLNELLTEEEDKVTRVSRLNSSIYVEKEIRIDAVKDFGKAKKEVLDRKTALNQRSPDSITESEIADVYGWISRCLEFYVEKELLCDILGRYRPNLRMHSLHKLKSIDTSKIEIIQALYRKTNRRGARHAPPTGSPTPKYSDLVEALKDFEQLF